MSETANGGNPKGPKNDLLWVCLCVSSEVAVSIILNRYSSRMPLLLVIGVCAIPLVLLIVVVWRHEKQHGWVKARFCEHPVSYTLIFLICLPFLWYTTAILISRLKEQSKPTTVGFDVKQSPYSGGGSALIPTKPDRPNPPLAIRAPAPYTPKPKLPRSTSVSPQGKSSQNAQSTNPLSAPSVDCTGMVGNCAGSNAGQQTFNQFGPPPIKLTTSSDIPQPEPSPEGHPRTAIKFFSDRADEDGQFAVICDRACKPVSLCALSGFNEGKWGSIPNFPNVAAFLFQRQFPAATWCTLTVESADENPVKIIGVRTLTITNPTPQ